MKILVIKPSSLGDVVHALPVLRLLKQRYPHAEIDWWISSGLEGILDEDPDLNQKHLFHRKDWRKPLYWPAQFKQIAVLRNRRYDLVLDLQGLARSAAMAWLVKGDWTVGVEDWREGAPALYDLSIPRPSAATHAVDWNLEILRQIRVPVHSRFEWMPLKPKASEMVRRKWPRRGPRIILNPGARWENKRWPSEYFESAARLLAKANPNVELVVLGGALDKPAGKSIAAAAPSNTLDLTGLTSLAELVEVVRSAELMITNDTGPMHIAAALGIRILALFGPTNPARTGPYGQINRAIQSALPCVPCMKSTCSNPNRIECLRSIRPDDIVEQALSQ